MEEIILQPGGSVTVKTPSPIIPDLYWAVWLTNENRYLGSHEGCWLYSEADARRTADVHRFGVAERFNPEKAKMRDLAWLRDENRRLRQETTSYRPSITWSDVEKFAAENNLCLVPKTSDGAGIDSSELWAIKNLINGIYVGTPGRMTPFLYPTGLDASRDAKRLGLTKFFIEKYRADTLSLILSERDQAVQHLRHRAVTWPMSPDSIDLIFSLSNEIQEGKHAR